MKIFSPVIIFILFFASGALAETITLKSGKVIEGEILERNKDYIKISTGGKDIYYENKYIKSFGVVKPVEISPEPGDPAEAVSGFKKGLELASAGKLDEAEVEFKKELSDINGSLSVLKKVKNGAITREFAIYLFQGSLYSMEEKYHEAAVSLEKAWEMNPKDPDVNFNLGACYFLLNDYQKSIIYLFAALKLAPEDLQAYELLAKAYYNTGKYQEAKESLLTVKALYQKNGDGESVTRIDNILNSMSSTVLPKGGN